MLAWTGYADSDLVKRFGQRLGVSVEVTIVSSDDQPRDKLAARQGRGFDVFAANTAELQRYIDQGKVTLPLEPQLDAKLRFLVKAKQRLGERRIDPVFAPLPGQPVLPIQRMVEDTGVPL